jgi:hypothetical protein
MTDINALSFMVITTIQIMIVIYVLYDIKKVLKNEREKET